jgi:hypothetical protein
LRVNIFYTQKPRSFIQPVSKSFSIQPTDLPVCLIASGKQQADPWEIRKNLILNRFNGFSDFPETGNMLSAADCSTLIKLFTI